MKFPRLAKGQRLSAELMNQVLGELERLSNVSYGAGIQVLGGGAGQVVTAVGTRGSGQESNPTALACTIGTEDNDTWSRPADTAVTVQVITDVYWSSPYIKGRLRTLKFDSRGMLFEITDEGSAVTLITAEAC